LPGFVQPAHELARFLAAGPQAVQDAIWRLVRAVASEASPKTREAAVEALGTRLAQLLALADLLGRRRVQLAVAAATPGGAKVAAAAVPEGQGAAAGLVPKITWTEAVRQIVERYPVVVPDEVRVLGYEQVQEWIGALYERQGMTLARTTQDVVVERVRDVLGRAMRGGQSKSAVLDQILAAGAEHGDDWTRGYAETVYRNNVNTAYTAGLEEEMRKPEVQRVMGAMLYEALLDVDTTPICRAAHGTLAPAGHPVWGERSPPLHHG
jgi:hypothetical protein